MSDETTVKQIPMISRLRPQPQAIVSQAIATEMIRIRLLGTW